MCCPRILAFQCRVVQSIDEEKLTLGKGIIDKINKILEGFELHNKKKLKEDSYVPSLNTVLKFLQIVMIIQIFLV